MTKTVSEKLAIAMQALMDISAIGKMDAVSIHDMQVQRYSKKAVDLADKAIHALGESLDDI
jgi:exosome complex RNA-binding protein Rrp42 (RNase PH superfamily)